MQEFKPTRELFGERYNSVRNKMRKVKASIVIITIVAMIMCFLMCFTSAYRVEKMDVESSGHYSQSEILDAAGLSVKSDMITFNADKAAAAIKANCPYLREVTVTCDYPNRVVINVEDEINLFYAPYGSSFVVLSDTLRVVDVTDSKEALIEKGYMTLNLPTVKEPQIGAQISAVDGRDMTYAVNFLSSVLSSEFGSEITNADIAEKFNLSVKCGQHVLYFGSSSNMDSKLLVAYNMIDDGVFSRYSSALCNISDPTGATVRENQTNFGGEEIPSTPSKTSTPSHNGAQG